MLAFEISHAHLNKRQRCGEKDICRTVFQRCRKGWHYIHETFYAQNFRAFIYLQNFLGTVFAACRLFLFHFMWEIHLFYFFCGLQNFCSDSTVTSNCKSASPWPDFCLSNHIETLMMLWMCDRRCLLLTKLYVHLVFLVTDSHMKLSPSTVKDSEQQTF